MQPKINWVNCMLIASNGIGDNDNWMMEKQWAKKRKKEIDFFQKKTGKINKSLYALVYAYYTHHVTLSKKQLI